MEKSLTPKQEQFCRAIPTGKNQSAAYRQAYNCTRMSDATVNVEASRLMDHPHIALRIKELTAPVVAQIQMTRAEWLSFMEKMLRFDPRKMFDRFGKLLEIGDMKENERLAIADFEKVEHLTGKGENRRVVGVTKKLKFIDRLKALEILGKAKGFYRNESDGEEGKIPPRVEVVFVDGPSGNGQVDVGESRGNPR
jgi:phage terminase small subunit